MSAAAAVLSNQVAKIAADDPKRAELIEQLQQMKQRIADTRAEIGGMVQSEEQLAAAMAATAAEQQRAIEAGQAGTASMAQMKAAAGLLEKQLFELSADDPGRAAMIADFQTLRARMEEARATINTVVKSEAELRAEEVALREAEAARLAGQQQAIAAGKQQAASFTEIKTAAGLLEKQLHDLATDDPNRAAMIADYQALKARMEALQQQMTRTSQSSVEIVVNGQRVSASMREMREAAAQLDKELDELAQDDPARGPLIASLQELKARIKSVGEEVAGVSETTGHMKQVMAYAFGSVVGGGIEGVIDKVLETGKAVFDTTAKFEKYGAVLTNALGSESLAQRAMKDIQKLAVDTPFSVDELTDSFIKFVNRGLNPSMAEMQNLADLAASQGKSFDQLTEAVLDAGTGEFERLKEFGIQASKSGDQVSLSFKGVQHTVANTPEAIQAALLSFGELKGVAGSTGSIMKTLSGQLSNVGDTADQTAVVWGEVLKPAFVAVLSTMGFLLGVLKATPAFIRDNKDSFIALGIAVMTLNAANIKTAASSLYAAAVERGRAIATTASTAAQWLLNAAMTANPIGLVIAGVALLVAGFMKLYNSSATVRAGISGLWEACKSFFDTLQKTAMQQLGGLADLIAGVFTFDLARIKRGAEALKNSFMTIGQETAAGYSKGYAAKMDEEHAAQEKREVDAAKKKEQKKAEVTTKARLEALKEEEAALKQRLAKVEEGSKAEMRLKQQLVTNAAAQQLLDDKKTAADRHVIEAEAEQKRADLARDYYQKQGELRKKLTKEAAEQAMKAKLADIEAEKVHQEMLAQVRQAAVAGRGDELVTEMSAIYTEGQMKIAALQAEAKKEIAQLTGSADEKRKRAVDLEKKLGAEVALVRAEVQKKQGETAEKYQKQDYDKAKTDTETKIRDIEAAGEREIAAFETPFHASLKLQQHYEDLRYKSRQASFTESLNLIEKNLGKESEEFKKKAAEMEKDQRDHNKRKSENDKKIDMEKQQAMQTGLRQASDVLGATLGLLDQDGEARKKHHTLYMALATAKIIMDGIAEVQAIWLNADSNWLNTLIPGWGPAWAAVQTGMAVARTANALNQLGSGGGGSGDGGGSYAEGGATGKGVGLATSTSRVAQVIRMMNGSSSMTVGSDGRLYDNTGFAVAGVVHEDEYVVPKWQIEQDPESAAMVKSLEARRMKGFAEGGGTTSGMLDKMPVVPAWQKQMPMVANVANWQEARRVLGVPGAGGGAAAATDALGMSRAESSELLGVMKQILAGINQTNTGIQAVHEGVQEGNQNLAGVADWPKKIQVVNNLRDVKKGLNDLIKTEHSSAMRRSGDKPNLL